MGETLRQAINSDSRRSTRDPLTAGIVVALLFGCATIISGKEQTISVNSNVAGADVYLNDKPLGKTPLTSRVQRGLEGTLRVQANGYTPYTFALNKSINNVFWVNIFIGGTFGSSTDYSTKAMYEYEPSTFFAPLQPASASKTELDLLQKREAFRRYVLLNYEAILHDLARRNGSHLTTMLGALAIADRDRDAQLKRWMDSATAARTSAEFADGFARQVN